MTTEQRAQYDQLVEEFLAKLGDPEKITMYNTKKRRLNKLGKLSVESKKRQ